MKRVKFMLLSLTLVAVVGGVLAFKAKTGKQFCTTLASSFNIVGLTTCVDPAGGPNATLNCPNLTQHVTVGGTSGNYICTTIVPQNGCQVDNPICATTTTRTKTPE